MTATRLDAAAVAQLAALASTPELEELIATRPLRLYDYVLLGRAALGSPLGAGMPDLSSVMRRASGVAALLPSLCSASKSRPWEIDRDWLWPCPPDAPLIELRGRGIRPSTLLTDELE